MLENYWADSIKETVLRSAFDSFNGHLKKTYRLGKTARINPGSLEDWPIDEQHILFSLLGDTNESIGLDLLESYLMFPTKSLSGIQFPTEEHFESCQLCPRENCPGRRANYEETL
jgi:cobalamin-dependent methionine synthase I